MPICYLTEKTAKPWCRDVGCGLNGFSVSLGWYGCCHGWEVTVVFSKMSDFKPLCSPQELLGCHGAQIEIYG